MADSHPHTPVPPTIGDYPSLELTTSFSETVHTVFSSGGVVDTLQRVVDLAVETIDGCDFAGIFASRRPSHDPSGYRPVVIHIDTLQHRAGEGPCLDAIANRDSIYTVDLADDPRWPRFGPLATRAEIRSALALGLSADGTRGALNLYARSKKANYIRSGAAHRRP
jgi:hypothetical protein